MDISELKELLQHAADEQTAPSPMADTQVEVRARRRRQMRRIRWASAGIVCCVALLAGAVAVTANNHRIRTATVAAPTTTPPGTWSIPPAGLELLHFYAQPDARISAVAVVEMKETTWANYVVWAMGTTGLPLTAGYLGSGGTLAPIFSSSDRIYVIAQTGPSDWAINVIGVGDPAGTGLSVSSPSTQLPPPLVTLPGPQAELITKTGQTMSRNAPAPGTPTVTVPSVVDLPIGAAVTDLESLGFSYLGPGQTGIRTEPSDNRHVTGQSPPAGFAAPAGSTVILTTSR